MNDVADGKWRQRQRFFIGALACVCCVVCVGCAAIGARIVDHGVFLGVRTDSAMVFERESFDPESRIHPVLAVADLPLSFVGDVIFLPYDIYGECAYVRNTNAIELVAKNPLIEYEP